MKQAINNSLATANVWISSCSMLLHIPQISSSNIVQSLVSPFWSFAAFCVVFHEDLYLCRKHPSFCIIYFNTTQYLSVWVQTMTWVHVRIVVWLEWHLCM